METIHTIGRRKTAVARVYMSEGKGEITINNKALDSYFPTATHQYKVNQPFTLTDTLGKYNLNVSVTGGGPTGQVEAIRLGISRALCTAFLLLSHTTKYHAHWLPLSSNNSNCWSLLF